MNDETVHQYQKRWVWLVQHYSSEGIPLSQVIKNVIDGTINSAKLNTIKPPTFRTYKAAICFGLAKCYLQLDDIDPSSIFIDECLTKSYISDLYKQLIDIQISPQKEIKYEKKTSAFKKKQFPEQFYTYLMALYKGGDNELNSRFNLLCAFIEANLIVGIRPIEWLNITFASDIKTKTVIAFVENGKNSQGRANGDIRELHLNEASIKEINKLLIYQLVLEAQLNLVSKFTNSSALYPVNKSATHTLQSPYEQSIEFLSSEFSPDFAEINVSLRKAKAEKFYKSLQDEMYRMFNLFLKESNYSSDDSKVSLYSTRHQCIANAKMSGISPYQIAAFFGHASIETNKRHYGKAWFGWTNFKFRPSKESILKVNGGYEYVNSLVTETTKNLESLNAIQRVKNDYRLK